MEDCRRLEVRRLEDRVEAVKGEILEREGAVREGLKAREKA